MKARSPSLTAARSRAARRRQTIAADRGRRLLARFATARETEGRIMTITLRQEVRDERLARDDAGWPRVSGD